MTLILDVRKLRLRTVTGLVLDQPSGRRQSWDLHPRADSESSVRSATPGSGPSKILNSFRLQELQPEEEPRDSGLVQRTWLPEVEGQAAGA